MPTVYKELFGKELYGLADGEEYEIDEEQDQYGLTAAIKYNEKRIQVLANLIKSQLELTGAFSDLEVSALCTGFSLEFEVGAPEVEDTFNIEIEFDKNAAPLVLWDWSSSREPPDQWVRYFFRSASAEKGASV